MRILFLTNSLGQGGIEQNIVRLTEVLTGMGHHVEVASRDGVLRNEVANAGGCHWNLQVRLSSPPAVWRDIRALRRVLAGQDRPDIVHNFAASTGILLRLAIPPTRQARPPVVASIMGLKASPSEPEVKTRLRAWVTTLAANRVLLISPAISRVVASLPVGRLRLVETKVVGVRLPAPNRRPELRDRARYDLGVGDTQPVVTTIGRLDPDKSHDLFVAAAAAVHERIPDARFFVVGEGNDRSALEALVSQKGLTAAISLLGRRSDVESLLAATDVYVKPGVVEGFIGITVLEAQALGVPVVAFDTEDVQLAVRDGETGLLAPRGDAAALARQIERILRDKALAHRLASEGRKAAEGFEIDGVARGLLELYLAEAEAKPGGRARRMLPSRRR